MKKQPVIDVLSADREYGLPVATGVPLKIGTVRDASKLCLVAPDGKVCPTAIRPLVLWKDKSVRWALASFLAREKGKYVVSETKKKSAVKQPVKISRGNKETTIDNGLVRVKVSETGTGPIQEITAKGRNWISCPEDLRFVVNSADTTREKKRTIQVLEESAVRVRVRVCGTHVDKAGKSLLNYRLDVELWAGCPTLRLDYQFFNLERGKENIPIDRIAMEWDVAMDGRTKRHLLHSYQGMNFLPKEVFNPAPVAIVADELCGSMHIEKPEMLLDDVKYPSHLRPPLIATSDWLGIGDGKNNVYVRMRDFAEMRPKRFASKGNKIELEIWPKSQGTLSLPQGRSRRQTIALTFSDKKMTAPEIEKLLNVPFYEGRAVVSPEWMSETGEFEADRIIPAGANLRFEKYFHRLVDLQMVQSMFDLGDTIDTGYCHSYISIPNNLQLKKNAPAIPRVFLARPHSVFAKWNLPELYEPVWVNNEYDGLFALCTEIMRTGRQELWQQARWLARHLAEVDFVHYHDDLQQNRATPQHSARHNMSGSVPSHYWTQGLLQYYCMTGDPDVLEVAVALGDKIIEDFTVPALRKSFLTFTREMGWSLLALSHVFDITGEERFKNQIEDHLKYLMNYKRSEGFEYNIAGALQFWSCMFEGADLFVRRTGRNDVKTWLVDFLKRTLEGLNEKHKAGMLISYTDPMVMAIGYEYTGDKGFLHAGMLCVEQLMDSPWWNQPPPEIKPMAVVYRGLVRFLYHAHKTGLLKRLEYVSLNFTK